MDGLTIGLLVLAILGFAAMQWAKHLKDHNH